MQCGLNIIVYCYVIDLKRSLNEDTKEVLTGDINATNGPQFYYVMVA